LTVPADQPGLRDLLLRGVPFPSGAVLRMQIGPPTPVAWINEGEQVVRGPIPAAFLRVEEVHVYGPEGTRPWRAQGTAPGALPPAAPYGASAGSQEINDWARLATEWVNAHL